MGRFWIILPICTKFVIGIPLETNHANDVHKCKILLIIDVANLLAISKWALPLKQNNAKLK